MFDGVPHDQFHQFIAAASRTSLPIQLPFPLHGSSPPTTTSTPPPPPNFPSFLDPYSLHHQHELQFHQLPIPNKDIGKKEEEQQQNLVLHRDDRSIQEPSDPWTNDEVLTLLRIRSSLESWFPDFTWEHVSRKLAELGFKRSAEKCKEKFEEESRNFNSLNYNKSYRFFTELDEIYHGENVVQVLAAKNQNIERQNEEEQKEEEELGQSIEEDSPGDIVALANNATKENEEVKKDVKSKKRKRKHKFDMVKGFCEAIVKKIMAQQEELHNKLMEDILKRDEEIIAREEAWKNQEMDRLNKEIEIRAKEQAIANDRQAILIDFLKKFSLGSPTSQDKQHFAKKIEDLLKIPNKLEMATNSSTLLVSVQNPSPHQKNPPNAPSSSSETLSPPQNPNSLRPIPNETSSTTLSLNTKNPDSSSTKMHEDPLLQTPSSSYKGTYEREDVGKRWPRDEVLALINLRCSLVSNSSNNNNNNADSDDNREGGKGPLWERISQGMQQLGYKRSAKRCKEKWENINKYFRKTKDNNKKRSLDSRTCPYYHQLSSLYSQGVLVAPTDAAENHPPTWPKHQRGGGILEETTSVVATQTGSNLEELHVEK